MNDSSRASGPDKRTSPLSLTDGSKIAVIGGGPSGSFFSYFVLDLAERAGIDISVDIFEEKDFMRCGPPGCNHCGGIVSESLVQLLSTEGINIPNDVLQRGIDSYVLHMEAGSTRIEASISEKRIAAVFRGAGPAGMQESSWKSFDDFLLQLSTRKGSRVIRDRVDSIGMENGKPVLSTKGGISQPYDLVVGATGLKNSSLELFKGMGIGYREPKTTKTFICEYYLGNETVQEYFGSAMHVFLLDIPRLEFAALIPKGSYVTLVMLGRTIDKKLVESFLRTPEVGQCFPPDWSYSRKSSCLCYPKINITTADRPFADRVVIIGDAATSKLYKNGIGSAYVAAKAAATTAVFHGISSGDFKNHYWPVCRSIAFDNSIGKTMFFFTRFIQKLVFVKRGILRVVAREQGIGSDRRYMSYILWDMFTGSAPYMDIFLRAMRPSFILRFILETAAGISGRRKRAVRGDSNVGTNVLGRVYEDGEQIIQQGEAGDCMYVIQSGTVEVLQQVKGKEIHLAVLEKDDFFGEMTLFEKEVRSATVRAKGEACLVTIDRKTILRRMQEDPSLVFRVMERMSMRIREMDRKTSRIKAGDRRSWDSRPERSDKEL